MSEEGNPRKVPKLDFEEDLIISEEFDSIVNEPSHVSSEAMMKQYKLATTDFQPNPTPLPGEEISSAFDIASPRYIRKSSSLLEGPNGINMVPSSERKRVDHKNILLMKEYFDNLSEEEQMIPRRELTTLERENEFELMERLERERIEAEIKQREDEERERRRREREERERIEEERRERERKEREEQERIDREEMERMEKEAKERHGYSKSSHRSIRDHDSSRKEKEQSVISDSEEFFFDLNNANMTVKPKNADENLELDYFRKKSQPNIEQDEADDKWNVPEYEELNLEENDNDNFNSSLSLYTPEDSEDIEVNLNNANMIVKKNRRTHIKPIGKQNLIDEEPHIPKDYSYDSLSVKESSVKEQEPSVKSAEKIESREPSARSITHSRQPSARSIEEKENKEPSLKSILYSRESSVRSIPEKEIKEPSVKSVEKVEIEQPESEPSEDSEEFKIDLNNLGIRDNQDDPSSKKIISNRPDFHPSEDSEDINIDLNQGKMEITKNKPSDKPRPSNQNFGKKKTPAVVIQSKEVISVKSGKSDSEQISIDLHKGFVPVTKKGKEVPKSSENPNFQKKATKVTIEAPKPIKYVNTCTKKSILKHSDSQKDDSRKKSVVFQVEKNDVFEIEKYGKIVPLWEKEARENNIRIDMTPEEKQQLIYERDPTGRGRRYRIDKLLRLYYEQKPDSNPFTDPELDTNEADNVHYCSLRFILILSFNDWKKYVKKIGEHEYKFKHHVEFKKGYKKFLKFLTSEDPVKVTKYGRWSRFGGNKRVIYFFNKGKYFGWRADEDTKARKFYKTVEFVSAKKGKTTKIMKRFKDLKEELCMSIILKTRTIDLQFEDMEIRDRVHDSINGLIKARKILGNNDFVCFASAFMIQKEAKVEEQIYAHQEEKEEQLKEAKAKEAN